MQSLLPESLEENTIIGMLDGDVAYTAPWAMFADMVNIVEGDITAIPCNALATFINSAKVWYGGVDRAIMRAAGNGYHAIAAAQELQDGDVLHIAANEGAPPNGRPYWDVIFVVDDQRLPTEELVERVLAKADSLAANNSAYTLNIPAFRLGVAAGIAESEEITRAAIVSALLDGPPNITINLVIYNEPELASWFRQQLS